MEYNKTDCILCINPDYFSFTTNFLSFESLETLFRSKKVPTTVFDIVCACFIQRIKKSRFNRKMRKHFVERICNVFYLHLSKATFLNISFYLKIVCHLIYESCEAKIRCLLVKLVIFL